MSDEQFPGFEDTAGRLLDKLGTRLSVFDQDWLRSYLWAGEEGLLADELAQILIDDQIPVDPVERNLLGKLLGFFDAAKIDDKAYPNICDRDQALASLHVVEEL